MSPRTRPQPAAPHGPDFLASVSDLMSALIFIFIITVAVFALRLARATTELAQAKTELTNAEALRRHVVVLMAAELLKEGIAVIVDPEQGVLRLTDRAIRFRRGESEPEPEHHAHVGVVANVLLRVLRCHVTRVAPAGEMPPRAARPPYCSLRETGPAGEGCPDGGGGARVNTVLVEGHTDSVPIGPGSRFRDNLDLSAARSAAVFRMMQQCEPELSGLMNRADAPVLSVSGYGESRPVDRDNREADVNRRIDLRILIEPPQAETAEPAPVEEVRRELAG